MKIPIFQVDAFTSKVFGGNPAAICVINEWLEDDLMQKIASENNLAETAFIVRKKRGFEIRWFTPTIEVDLCGHATLAAAHVLLEYFSVKAPISFYSSRSGDLKVNSSRGMLTLDFPKDEMIPSSCPDLLIRAFGKEAIECRKGKTDYLIVFGSEEDILLAKPDLKLIANMDGCRGVIITAKGQQVDFVSRFFAPQSGIDEDPVTGSAHTSLTPYWASKLEKSKFTALQLSKRGGELWCEMKGERVLISGKAVTYMQGEIEV